MATGLQTALNRDLNNFRRSKLALRKGTMAKETSEGRLHSPSKIKIVGGKVYASVHLTVLI